MDARLSFAVLLAAVAVWLPFSVCQDSALAELFKHSEDAPSSIHQRVAAPTDALPYYVSFKHNGAHFCAGTRISWSWILTSASCMDLDVYGHPLAEITADVGASTLTPTRQLLSDECTPQRDVGIERVEIPPEFSGSGDNATHDVALVELEREVSLPWATLPLEVPDCCDGEDLLNVGYGSATRLQMAAFHFQPCADALKCVLTLARIPVVCV